MDKFAKESLMEFLDYKIAPKITQYNQTEQEYLYILLIKFFARYYCSDGFNSSKRTTEKLSQDYIKMNWAHEDQYYVKTTENFKDIEFILKDDITLIFKIVFCEISRDNNKYFGKRFIVFKKGIRDNNKIEFYFEYKNSNKYLTQKECNVINLQKILDFLKIFDDLDIQKKKYQTNIEGKLRTFTNIKNKDVFIHKNIEKFLKGELEGFIKDVLYSSVFH